MNDDETVNPPALAGEGAGAPAPDGRWRDLAELDQEIRRRLRSNQQFLERFLDEDFVDDEASEDEEPGGDEEEL